ncbi:hydroxymethylglutaryl-CoA lyase [Heyndrickxia sp. FSL K6-6286]|uniref:hydroxymethylglutaryl-CoA lyase n=1 Tax=Heyndrickxia TaxID=2837504 RepID=UPI0009040EF8|nr:hydroxymethylglutaryl-CoA lyase [Heyndrickxia oleronia]MBU5210373.1 hydroxymethylglutaryl-CoA lyase [Heyndrickxia oleronia]NYV64945.1 hydroxymethylglutaryl-CoA lyase [Bacillus sp. Gen3]OJH19434.1 hydroxymethylglutaryl-CoA lyase [Bacillus obstructivus]
MADVKVIEVSPRDGLQNDPNFVVTSKKKELVNLLIKAGLKQIEVTSFVHPKKVPQMADAPELLNEVISFDNFEAIALIPNLKGYDRAKEHTLSEINWVSSATETFNKKNIGMTIDDNFKQFESLVKKTENIDIKACFSIAVSFGCPYEGKVNEENVLKLVKRARNVGADRIGIADTIGIATPDQVESLMKKVLEAAENTPVAIHLHDTRGLGLANAYSAYQSGIRIFETSVSGIGGCPFAPGAAGNLATEDLVYLFHRMGIDTGIDFDKLLDAADYAASISSMNPLGRIRHVARNESGRE